MTKEEFEKGYAERSGITVEKLKEFGQEGRACDCDEEICKGWQMVTVSDE